MLKVYRKTKPSLWLRPPSWVPISRLAWDCISTDIDTTDVCMMYLEENEAYRTEFKVTCDDSGLHSPIVNSTEIINIF